MAQNHVLSCVSCCVGRSKNLICPSESPFKEEAKIGIGLISSSNNFRENQQKVFTKKLGFIDVLRTVHLRKIRRRCSSIAQRANTYITPIVVEK